MRVLLSTFTAVLLASTLPACAFHRDERAAAIVRCDSGDGRRHECAIDSRGGVRFVKQLSHGRCVEGQTWGRGRDSVWVTGGCRAEVRTRRHRQIDGRRRPACATRGAVLGKRA